MSSAPASRSTLWAGRLIVWESRDTVYVGWEDAEEDWLACFTKSPDFPARAWAERMADLFNGEGGAPDPAGRLGSYAPPPKHVG